MNKSYTNALRPSFSQKVRTGMNASTLAKAVFQLRAQALALDGHGLNPNSPCK